MTGCVICHDVKVRRSYRIDSLADAVIKRLAAERHCSEAEVIEKSVIGSSGVTGNTVACDAAVVGSSPTLPTISEGIIAPKGSFTKADLAALIQRKESTPLQAELSNVPNGSFDLNINGEPHRVAQMGKGGMWLFYLSEEGNKPMRKLADGEYQTLWAKRIIK